MENNSWIKHSVNTIRDILVIFILCFIFSWGLQELISGHRGSITIVWNVIEAAYYGAICSLIFVVGHRFFKKRLFLFLLSLGATIILFLKGMYSAQNIGLYQKVLGIEVYVSGEITMFGIFYQLLNPVGVMLIGTLIYWLISCSKKSI